MPPHLHPRSTATSTLFAGTLLASFTVVAIPHIFPCPRPRRAYADAERRQQHLDNPEEATSSSSIASLRPKKRRRRPDEDRTEQNRNVEPSNDHPPYPIQTQTPTSAVVAAAAVASLPGPPENPKDTLISDEAALFRQFQAEAAMLDKEAHACPVPKPGGILGRILGFQQQRENASVDEDKQDAAAKRPGR